MAAAALPRPAPHLASHRILDLHRDPVQVSRILGHARVTITLDVHTHLFDGARHAAEIRARMAQSAFAQLLEAGSRMVESSKRR